MTTEFFKTLKEAEEFALQYNPNHVLTDVYSLDKPGTARKFKTEQDDAIACGRCYANSARAVVVLYR